ncbi:Ubiquinone/menaquinone biosynthesis C-methylase UbiE [Marininema mesophilum]|uniref:Ubiquinone/menaquinone biosynthesis C-methylase UbiE n=1 Tax=Marininema mesophilum TaxID=1048340 RepID=A0A1H2VD15_9BACL|nr:class I SAM-dependent methyltransferase [Marininema mesophilum]SDW65779.1 Ubiquinone/menaquinone biosynthesis C-methylase UbiE [Marininema mesophilum]
MQLFNDHKALRNYMERRGRDDNPNKVLEGPVMSQLIGAVEGLDILDLGCGDAGVGRKMIQQGCRSYTGLEGAPRMAEKAREGLAGTRGQLVETDITEWDYPEDQFDLVISSLVFHYIEEMPQLLKKVYRTLKPGGRLIFSVEHPIVTSCFKGYGTEISQRHEDWRVDDYFYTGERVKHWLGNDVRIFHHTVEEWFLMVQKANFTVDSLRESCPEKRHFSSEKEYRRRMRVPLFLFLKGKK